MSDLFTEPAQAQPTSDDLATRIGIFLNRWQWRGERAIVRAELEDLIAFAVGDVAAESCVNGGCQARD